MERVVSKAKSFEQAAKWDIQQQVRMSPQERCRAARILKERLYPNAKDVRECHRPK